MNPFAIEMRLAEGDEIRRVAKLDGTNALRYRILAGFEGHALDDFLGAPDTLDIDEARERVFQVVERAGEQPFAMEDVRIPRDVEAQSRTDLHDGLRAKAGFQVAVELDLGNVSIIHALILPDILGTVTLDRV